jgi:hypothetical protein
MNLGGEPTLLVSVVPSFPVDTEDMSTARDVSRTQATFIEVRATFQVIARWRVSFGR